MMKFQGLEIKKELFGKTKFPKKIRKIFKEG